MIHFNVPPVTGNEIKYIQDAISAHKICGDGQFTKKCHAWLEEHLFGSRVLLTTSGTTALEMAALLCDIQAGDEVIMPSYTFCSTEPWNNRSVSWTGISYGKQCSKVHNQGNCERER